MAVCFTAAPPLSFSTRLLSPARAVGPSVGHAVFNTSPCCTWVEPDTNNTITCLPTHPLRHLRAGLSKPASKHLSFSLGPPTLAGPFSGRDDIIPKFDLCFFFLSTSVTKLPVLTVILFPFPPDNEFSLLKRGEPRHIVGRRRTASLAWNEPTLLERGFLPPGGKVGAVLLRASRRSGDVVFVFSHVLRTERFFYFLICQDMEYIPFSLFPHTQPPESRRRHHHHHHRFPYRCLALFHLLDKNSLWRKGGRGICFIVVRLVAPRRDCVFFSSSCPISYLRL